MGTKNNPGAFDCYANAEPDEPMFVLLGRDKHAAALVFLWAAMRELDGEDPAKVDEATNCANSMVEWYREHKSPVPAGIKALALGLIELADSCGVVLTIEQVPTPDTPLAMGNYVSQVTIRKRRERAA